MADGNGTMAMSGIPAVLVVAGSDSSGGAGIARDLATLNAFGVEARLAITAVTAQTRDAFDRMERVPADLVERQMRAALADPGTAAVKLGMLATAATAQAVASTLADHPALPLVIDPVLASSSGRALVEGSAGTAYAALLPLATVLTPNIPELALLTGSTPAETGEEALRQARQLLVAGARAVLVKGGHARDREAIDLLVMASGDVERFAAPRLPTEMRGTGCTLASAIAARLAQGHSLVRSIADAKDHVQARLRSALSV